MTASEPWVILEQHGMTDKSSIIQEGCSLFHPFPANKPCFPVKNIPDLLGKMTLASAYGWLIASDLKDPASVFLFNPFSRATINLPRLELFSDELLCRRPRVKYIMTCVPDDDHIEDGRCVLMVSCKSIFMFCRPGYDDSWCMHYAPLKGEVHDDILGVCNGSIYRLVVLINSCILFRIDIDSHLVIRVKSVAQLKLTDVFRQYQSPLKSLNLVESCGQLYCVVLYYGYQWCDNIENVHVLKFVNKDDTDALEVTEVHSLENQALFVGSNNCGFASYVSSTRRRTATRLGLPYSGPLLQENCVYVLVNLGVPVIYVYHLLDCTLTPIPLPSNIKPPRGPCFWITSIRKKRNAYENK